MANFLEDPRLRQRWNQISHNAEAVTENAAVGFWNFQHHYINPCLASLGSCVEASTAPCFGDHEERARRRRERARSAGRAEYSFDFYDDWYADDEGGGSHQGGGGGILGSWGREDWDRLLAGTGSSSSARRHHGAGGSGELAEQPRRKRGMSYGTRADLRRKSSGLQDPTIIPSTQPIGFLGKLPWKIGGTLRYKPSAADLQEHPGRQHGDERQHTTDERAPLLGGEDGEDDGFWEQENRTTTKNRKRSGTTGSGDTSDSFRSRGDLFPSDEEGEEDAVPLDDEEFSFALDKVVDDRGSSKTRSSSGAGGAGKGKRPAAIGGAAGNNMSRTVSRTTIGSTRTRRSSGSMSRAAVATEPEAVITTPSMEDLRREEREAERAEDEALQRKRRQAAALAVERGLVDGEAGEPAVVVAESKSEEMPAPIELVDGSEPGDHRPVATRLPEDEVPRPPDSAHEVDEAPLRQVGGEEAEEDVQEFVGARLPRFH